MQYNGYLFSDTEAAITGAMKDFGLTEEDLANVGNVLNYANPCEM